MTPQNRNVKKRNSKSAFNKTVAVLGAGKMGSILVQGLLSRGLLTRSRVCATVGHPDEVRAAKAKLNISVTMNNAEAVRNADVVLLCLKPQAMRQVLEEIKPVLKNQLVISVAASVPTSYMENILGGKIAVIRTMPNTACMVGCGMIAITKGAHATERQVELARVMFDTVGRTVVVDEKHMDAVTGLSGSGPAYIYTIIESLAEAGVKVGLPREVATLLASQTTMGAAQVVLQTGDHPALLKDAVTTPAGCTVDGLMELEEGKLRVTLIKAVVKATHRAKELLFTES
jgi:pyrroline-5-carboxylate reductase